MQRLIGAGARSADPAELHPLTYLLVSGSDRIGALDFQESPETYTSRQGSSAPLEELMEAADRVAAGIPLSPALDRALATPTTTPGTMPRSGMAPH